MNTARDFSPPHVAGGTDSMFLSLNRHQRRREQAIPTLSVLVGPSATAAAVWQSWVESVGWPPPAVRPCGGSSDPTTPSSEPPAHPPARAVLYLFGPESKNLAATIEHFSRWLDVLGAAQAQSALALSLERADAAEYLRAEPYSRTRALFAEGIVELPPADLPRPKTTVSFETAASPDNESDDDRARSAAERYLFDLLDALPDTRGLFELNARLGFCFGPMPAEVDLLAAGLKLAVEIDGFHHFREPAGYRRDRRKDVILQQQGYLVLRFLADDVVTRLEEIVEEIRAAVAFRRATR